MVSPNRKKEKAGAELCQAQGKLRLSGLCLLPCFNLIDAQGLVWFRRFGYVSLIL